MVRPLDPFSVAFLMVESRTMPMHVSGLQLFAKPDGAPADYTRRMYDEMVGAEELAPLFRRRPRRSWRTAEQLVWVDDDQFDIEHHVRHSALPEPGRVRELLDLCGRLHGTRLARERPLWESHVIEGLADGRVAMYTKIHHALVDGVAAMRLLADVLSTDPDERDMAPPWGTHPVRRARRDDTPDRSVSLAEIPVSAIRTALGLTAEAAGLPSALVRTLRHGLRNETSAVSLAAPRTIFNQPITGSRRVAADDWPMQRLHAVGKATGTTINDVVLAMCAGAVRAYLLELGALPDQPLVAMVPVSLDARQARVASAEGGNAVGAVMVQLATDRADPARRLGAVHRSMKDGKQALSAMTPMQVVAMSAVGQVPAILAPALRMQGFVRPPYNLIISNVPGPREKRWWNGAELVGAYPLSIAINGMALNITCASYAGQLAFGLTGCRRTVPHLQRFLGHLDAELTALEQVAGL